MKRFNRNDIIRMALALMGIVFIIMSICARGEDGGQTYLVMGLSLTVIANCMLVGDRKRKDQEETKDSEETEE